MNAYFFALRFEQTSPLGVPMYAVGIQFVQSTLFCFRPEKCKSLRKKERLFASAFLFRILIYLSRRLLFYLHNLLYFLFHFFVHSKRR